jgi:type IV pilus assembly protein PilB
MSAERLGELLIRKEMITDDQLAKAVTEQKKDGIRLGAALIRLGYIQETDLAGFLSKHYGVPSINLADFQIDPAVIELVPAEVVQKYQLIPVNRAGSTLIVAMSDPSNIFAIDDIKFMTGYNVEVVVAAEAAIKAAIDEYYDQSSSLADVMGSLEDFEDLEIVEDAGLDDLGDLERATEDAPVVKLCNLILIDAIKRKASISISNRTSICFGCATGSTACCTR